MDKLDIAIIGAGWHGLAMAKTYMEVCPDASMAIFDGAASIGGTWAKERLYPGLKTNNVLGTYEFSDFPMNPGSFAHHFHLASRIQLKKKVKTAELFDDGSWSLCIASAESVTEPRTVIARKLVLATGLTSEPFMPEFVGEKDFNRPLFHAKDLRDRVDEIEKARNVVVLGGNKSAWDTCFFAAKAGVHVHMVIRPSGGGPSWVWPVRFSPFKISIQRLAVTRFFTWLDPCIWSESSGTVGWLRSALHGTRVGRAVVSTFWDTIQGFAERVYRYDDHPQTQKLRPWASPFWVGNSLSIHNYTSPWFDLVREGKITVHIANVSSLSDGKVHLSNGENLDVDAFICCTGWATEPSVRFLPEGIKTKLGLQRSNSIEDRKMVEIAREDIFKRLPAVRGSPNRHLPPGTPIPAATPGRNTSSGYQLYRFLISSDEEILQALWITAFFVDQLPHLRADALNHSKVRYEAILHNEYSAIRHPREAGGAGSRYPDLVFDCLSYMDLLSSDLGLQRYRKYGRTGLWPEMFYRYGPRDFKGMVQEWLDERRKASVRREG